MRFCFSLAQGVYAWDDSAVISGFSPIYGASRGLEGSVDWLKPAREAS
jgi:hypothetical protein